MLRIPRGRLKREWSLLAYFWTSQQELSRYLKYMAGTRCPEFESDMPSHAVSLRGLFAAARFAP
jgi:hypothetical protein